MIVVLVKNSVIVSQFSSLKIIICEFLGLFGLEVC